MATVAAQEIPASELADELIERATQWVELMLDAYGENGNDPPDERTGRELLAALRALQRRDGVALGEHLAELERLHP